MNGRPVRDELQDQLDAMAAELATLRGELQQSVADGIAEGLRRVLEDPAAIAAVLDVVVSTAQQRAAEHAGRAFLGMVRVVLGRYLVIGAIVVLALKLGGAEVAGKTWKLLTGGTP